MQKLLIFASGTATGGGSGFEALVENSLTGILQAEVVGVVSNHGKGGVRQRADRLGVPFTHFDGPWTADRYKKIVSESKADHVALSGWLKLAAGLDPRTTINIHPAPLPEFGGRGLYGHRVHEAVIKAFRAGQIKNSAVSMHFVTEEYDRGAAFFEYPVAIQPKDTPEALAARVNEIEHGWQSFITNLVVQGEISWDGSDPKSLKVPDWYPFLKK